MVCLVVTLELHAADGVRPKRVLIISTGSRLAPGFQIIDEQLLQELGKVTSARIETFAENLDIIRFPSERLQRIFSEYLSGKYAEQPPDLVILVYVGNLGIAGKLLPQLFPGTPIIVTGLTEEDIRTDQLSGPIRGLAQRVDSRAGIELILRLQPDTRRIVIIGGTAEVDRQILQRTREAARSFEGRTEFDFWDNKSMAELRRAVSALPSKTVILFTRMFRDAAGHSVISSQVGRSIGELANVPVYGMSDSILGSGAVGGSVASVVAIGKRAGELARLVLSGTDVKSLPFEIRTDSVAMVDWRALKRWGISEDRLPPNSVVRFRPLSLWGQYRWYIIAALILIFVQSAMIIDLLLQRRRRIRIQTALQESQELMELASSAGELGMWARDLGEGGVWANPSMRSLFGFGTNDVVRFKDLIDRVYPIDRERMLLAVEHAQTAGMPFQGEFRVVLPDGEERWVLAKGRTMDCSAMNGRRMGVVLDVTERKRAEENLRESEERFRTMADTAPVMIWMSGTGKLCTFFNKGWLDFTGRTLEQELGDGWTEGVHPDDFDRCLEIYTNAFNARREFTAEYRLRRFDGKYCWILDRGVPRSEAKGHFLGYIGCAIDITERKRGELEAVQQRAELAHIARVSTMGELAASLAHELNQPLTAILSNAQAAQRFLALKPPDLEELHEILKDIVQDDSRAGEIIRRMRALVKKDELEFALLDLGNVVSDVVLLTHSDATLHNIRVLLEIKPDLPAVRGDKVQLQQVLLNLLLNAFDAVRNSPENERSVAVEADRDGASMLKIAVHDSGIGLTGDEIAKIFQPFYSTKRDGLGMGLSICRSIVEAHGGRLWAENNFDRGATFYFTLPFEKLVEQQMTKMGNLTMSRSE
jgi:PAS domain S-box-containing protein